MEKEYWIITENDESVYFGQPKLGITRHFGSLEEAESEIEEWAQMNEGSGARQTYTIVAVLKSFDVVE